MMRKDRIQAKGHINHTRRGKANFFFSFNSLYIYIYVVDKCVGQFSVSLTQDRVIGKRDSQLRQFLHKILQCIFLIDD